MYVLSVYKVCVNSGCADRFNFDEHINSEEDLRNNICRKYDQSDDFFQDLFGKHFQFGLT